MARYCFYVDGFNVYHALADFFYYPPGVLEIEKNRRYPYRKYKWLNYWQLAKRVIGPKDDLAAVYYFTTLAFWRPDSVSRHQSYIAALKNVRVNVIEGRFEKRTVGCHLCSGNFDTHIEKRTDVNIALRLLGDAFEDLYDRAVIVTADSDLLPVVRAVHHFRPTKKVGIMLPIRRENSDLRSGVDFRLRMSDEHLRESQFPDAMTVNGATLVRPEHWR